MKKFALALVIVACNNSEVSPAPDNPNKGQTLIVACMYYDECVYRANVFCPDGYRITTKHRYYWQVVCK
jgi:hypothetical protein